jgi:DNA-binding NarL/FixJ family response regulator
MIHILIADDHLLLREAWSMILRKDHRFMIIGSCSNSTQAVKMSRKLRPDVLLLDINMAPYNGIEAAQKIRLISPETRIIALTMSNDPAYAKKMFQLGAMGYVTKNSSIEEMTEAILTVSKGDNYVCNEMKEILTASREDHRKFQAIQLLTKREIQVIEMIKSGHSSKEICEELDITLNTVETHRYNILKKLGVKNAASLIHFMNDSSVYA